MQIFIAIGQFLSQLTLKYGVIGLGVGAFLESFGIPTASAVIEVTAGLLILSGRATFLQALLVSDLGLVLGSLAAYQIGRGGASFFERWHRHPRNEAEKRSRARQLIKRYGDKSIFFAQFFGPARTWISYPAGAMGMDIKKFTIYTAIGGAIYCAAIITLSVYLTDFIKSRFEEILSWVTTLPAIVGLVLGLILLIFVRKWWRTRIAQTRQLSAVEAENHADADQNG
ncbi:MAG: DedA family protein [Actinomycetota bacterium]|nr:DedA family protein [Actinomycetota bacterium]